MKLKEFFIGLFYYCFPFVLLCQLLVAFGLVSDNYPLTLLNVEYLIVGGMSILYVNYNKDAKLLVLLFILYTALSGVVYIFNDRPISCYIDAVRNYILPMLMFFIGMNCSFDTYKFITPFAYTLTVTLLVTLFAYVTFAPWYTSYVTSNVRADEIDATLNFLRFSGPYQDNYYIQYLCVGMLAYYLYKVIVLKIRGKFDYFILIILVLSLIMCQQRSAMLFTFLSIPYFLFFTKHRMKYITVILLILFVVAVVAYYYVDVDRTDAITRLLSDRAENMTFSKAFGERREKVLRVFPVWSNIIFGDGVGVYSHEAFYNGFVSVNDNGWIKLLVEQGIVGVLFFVYIVVISLNKAIKRIREYIPEVFIIIFYMVAMVGSDSLSMVIEHSVFFWFALGRIWCKTNKCKIGYLNN